MRDPQAQVGALGDEVELARLPRLATSMRRSTIRLTYPWGEREIGRRLIGQAGRPAMQTRKIMMTRRDFVQTAGAAGAAAILAGAGNGAWAASSPLQWKHFPAGENGFFRAPVLLSGTKEAILVDGGFSLPDGRAVAEGIKASGKTLTTIYISQSDPDYYFSLGPIKAAFPSAKVIAASATIAAIKASAEKKLAVWGPQLKENGPQRLADIVMPEAFDGATLSLESHRIDIVPAEGLENRRYLWVPSLDAVFGGVLVFSGLHVWTADTATSQARAAWIRTLDAIAARKPSIVVPGHMPVNGSIDGSSVAYTRDYLIAFDEELARAADSAALIAAMTKRYPNAGLPAALQVGAKVAKGELKWD